MCVLNRCRALFGAAAYAQHSPHLTLAAHARAHTHTHTHTQTHAHTYSHTHAHTMETSTAPQRLSTGIPCPHTPDLHTLCLALVILFQYTYQQ